MIEKIIERLKEARDNASLERAAWKNMTGIPHNRADARNGAFIDAIEIVQEVAKDGGWIPCSERMPENDFEEVLVWFEYFRYGEYNRLFQTRGISYTYNGEWSGFVNGSSGWRQLRIIAWQPLPPDYQEGER